MNTSQKGKEGENRAITYLKEAGYRITERNYRKKEGEIDIIAEKDGEMVFLEVKSLSGLDSLELEGLVNRKKRDRIIRTAREYLFEKGIAETRRLRFDVILCERHQNTITHYENAFTESGIL
ncbi:MAG: YraN family protein [Spirochaetales bacterium]|nr:YraN family protein [Spirochaetales bacterium]